MLLVDSRLYLRWLAISASLNPRALIAFRLFSSHEQPLPAGAVISAEPGVYLPGKLGVRIEDVILLTETGCRNLTKAPKALLIL